MAKYTWVDDELVPDVKRLDGTEPETGETYLMYHGTQMANAQAIIRGGFHLTTGGILGRGIYLTGDLNKARKYPVNVAKSERVVFRVKVNVGKVIAIEQDNPRQRNWHDSQFEEVFDTAWCSPESGMTKNSREIICVWDTSRIEIDIQINPIVAPSQFTWKETQLPSGSKRLKETRPKTGVVYVMYYGTKANVNDIMEEGFPQSTDGALGRGVYLRGNLNDAIRDPLDVAESQWVVFRVKVKMRKVIVIDEQGHPRQRNWHDAQCGEVFDTAWCPPNCGMSSMMEICVWDPKHIAIDKQITPTQISK